MIIVNQSWLMGKHKVPRPGGRFWLRSLLYMFKADEIDLLLPGHQMKIMKYILASLIIVCAVISCSPAYKFNKDKRAFEASKVQQSFKSVADMNDSYFEIKENNFFEFYRQLFDSIKNTSYPGRYEQRGDTLYLKFYDKKGLALLGSKAVIKGGKKEIVFFK
jgi:hypothetical protein